MSNTWNPSPFGYGATWQGIFPPPTLASRGAIYQLVPIANMFVTGVDASGNLLTAQPTFSGFSGQLAPGQIPSGYYIDAPVLTGIPKTPGLTGYLYANGGTGWTASANIPANVLTGTIAGQRLPAPTSTILGGVFSALAAANQFQTGVDTTGAPTFAQPSFSNISGVATGSQLPNPAAASKGGVLAATAGTNQFQRGIDTSGNPLFAQPAFSNLSGTATGAQLPAPTATTFGGVFSAAAPANQFGTGVSTTGAPTFAQPSFTNLSGAATASQMPAFSGDASTPAGSTAITFNTVNANAGNFGSSTVIPSFAVNGKGLITAANSNPVIAPAGTLTGTTLAAGVTGSSLTSLGTVVTGTWNATRIGHAYRVQAPALTLRGNLTGATADVSDSSLTAYIDAAIGSTRGSVLVRGATAWLIKAPSTAGQVPTFDGTDTSFASPGAAVTLFPGLLFGHILANNTTNPNTSLDIGAGTSASDDAAVRMALASAITKTMAAWAAGGTSASPVGGLDTGTAAANTWYHVFVIYNPTSLTTDAILSTSISAPALPSGYTKKRRVGAVRTTGTATNFLAFTQNGDEFIFAAPIADVAAVAISTGLLQPGLSVPPGLKVKARVRGYYGSATSSNFLLAAGDETVSAANSPPGNSTVSAIANGGNNFTADVYTNATTQVKAIATASGTYYVNTYGWIDPRGRAQ